MLANKTCIVTGSTAGIGKAIAGAFLKEGAFVFINGRSEATVNEAIRSFEEQGLPRDHIHGIVADISTKDGSQTFFDIVQTTGRFVDVLVNNMGIFSVKDFFDLTDDDYEQYFQVNVLSTIRFSRQYLKAMLTENKGRIITISSECGMRPIPDMIHYSMTKAAQISISRGLAELTKGSNVTVNSLLPGPTMTEGINAMVDKLVEQSGGKSREEVMKEYFATREPNSLLQRFLTTNEIADTAVFLASDRSSGINGSAMRVEGGVIRAI
eukprot:gene6850-7571_t